MYCRAPAPGQAAACARQAERDSGVAEVTLVREEAKRWEARVNELLLKYSSVDLAEYTRVTTALKVYLARHAAAPRPRPPRTNIHT